LKLQTLIAISLLLPLPLLIASACSSPNKPPTAYIDSISPSNPQTGQTVVFTGHGSDEDGNIAGYEWRSSIDGALGNGSTLSIDTLSEGQHTISLKVCDDDGACSQEESATLVVSNAPLDEQAAANAVIDYIIEPMNFDGPIIGFKLDDTLKPGDTIAPYDGEKQVIDEESYFYFIDLHPETFYAHDVLFVLVGKDSGEISVSTESWWPLINGRAPGYVDDEEEYWDEDNRFYSADVARPYSEDIVTPQVQVPQQHQWREASVIVEGIIDGEALRWDGLMSAWQMSVLFDYYITPGETYEVADPDNTPDDLFSLLDDLCADGYDYITIYLIGHGNIDLIVLGGSVLYADDLVDFIEGHPGTTFSILLESCHIGSFIDDLSELSNVKLVLTATSSLFPAKGDVDTDSDPNPEDSGAEWTSSMYASVCEQLAPENWDDICYEANRLTVPPSVVLLLTAFNNAGDSDSRDLDAGYIEGMEFPHAWSPLEAYCTLWEDPPPDGEALLLPDAANSGYVTSSGTVVTGLSEHSGNLWFGYDDTQRYFFSFTLPDDVPDGSTVLAAYIYVNIWPELSCSEGPVGDLIIERLSYGTLDPGDFGAPGEEVVNSREINCYGYHSRHEFWVHSVDDMQEAIDSHQNEMQFRFKLASDSEVKTIAPDITIYYEVR